MHIFKSPQRDLEKLISMKLEVIQTQIRALRDDNSAMHKDIRTIVKAIALIVTAPEPDDEELEAR